MKITEIRVYPIGKGGILANASVTLDGEFAVNVAIRENKNGDPFICFPSHSYENNGERVFKDDFFPVTAESREYFVSEVLNAYDEKMGEDEKPKAKTTSRKYGKK